MKAATFNDIVSQAVAESMSTILGENTWRAVTFFFDTKTAAEHPEEFAKLLDRMFGLTSRTIQNGIAESLLRRVGAATRPAGGTELGSIFKLARARFLRPISLG